MSPDLWEINKAPDNLSHFFLLELELTFFHHIRGNQTGVELRQQCHLVDKKPAKKPSLSGLRLRLWNKTSSLLRKWLTYRRGGGMGRRKVSPAGFADVPQSHPLLGVGRGDESGLHGVEHHAVEGRRVAGQAERLCRDTSRRQHEQAHVTHTTRSLRRRLWPFGVTVIAAFQLTGSWLSSWDWFISQCCF